MFKFPSLCVIAKPGGTVLCYEFSAIVNDFVAVFKHTTSNIRTWNSIPEAQVWLDYMKSMSRYDWHSGTGCYTDFENGEDIRPEEFVDAFVLEYKAV